MSSNYSVSLIGPSPWGFRLQGGKDFSMPLTVSKLTDGGKAAKAKISVGDIVLSIDGIAADSMTHLEAQNKIKACTGNLNLTLQRPSTVTNVAKDEPQEIIKPVPISHPPAPVPSASPVNPAPSSTAYNKTARPFGGGGSNFRAVSPSSSVPAAPKASIPSASSAFTPAAPSQQTLQPPQAPQPVQPAQPPQPPFPLASSTASRSLSSPHSAPKPTSGRSPFPHSSSASSSGSSSPARVTAPSSSSSSVPAVPQPSVYNTPINLYSNENACEVAMGQRRGLLESQAGVEHHNGGPHSILKKTPPRAPRKPIMDTELVVNHGSHLSDASKKRLIEDTEDWRPRTGTSQSRSFRILAQITGTENEQAHESSPGKNEAVEDVHPSAHTSSTVKTMTKAPAGAPRTGNGVPPPTTKSWQSGGNTAGFPKAGAPAGHTGPSYGRVSNSVTKGPDRPTPQPHPKDQDTLVQRAEHIPAGTRTPMCAHCNMVIRGPFLVAMGKSWHPEEFNCAHCNCSLAELGFVEERGAVYCEHCYEQFFAPTCCRCQQKVLGEVINALKQTWHVYCFLCTSCQQPIRNNTFHLEDGQPYCERDYYALYGTSCHGCDFPIEAGDKFLEALGFTWHDTCFVCSVCNTSLEGQTFFSKKDKPLCKKHAHTLKM
ncbi:PDZ and LIM domain protein 5b isoform X1 [Colossoma macropomum]|uniref:PDZ and LIM domain protein 5b isoform X1 n=1 Tax=Colossoma macropomum TaxID=42526 RepID=UPI001864BFDD|nr:PDZ and LIM domain protein 5b isoform X1 [Colossoma macropomum]XP_036451828.1 PDZ and LIM domain protein 5b isoform X1 [Colossoma macropomum]XP_036451829.1 PDZ and LIM domain protein 5b isoform X1 [Colossoma macropomum]